MKADYELLREGDLDVDAFLQRPLFAHLSTWAADGGPRDSPVWFLWEDAAFWIITNRETDSFPSRLEVEPRCALGVVDFEPRTGRVHHVGVRGVGEVTPWDGARARRKLRRYLGEDEAAWDRNLFTLDATTKPLALVRVTPRTMVARDQSFSPSLR